MACTPAACMLSCCFVHGFCWNYLHGIMLVFLLSLNSHYFTEKSFPCSSPIMGLPSPVYQKQGQMDGAQERYVMPRSNTCPLILGYEKEQTPAHWCLWLSPVSTAGYFSSFLFRASRKMKSFYKGMKDMAQYETSVCID